MANVQVTPFAYQCPRSYSAPSSAGKTQGGSIGRRAVVAAGLACVLGTMLEVPVCRLRVPCASCFALDVGVAAGAKWALV